VPFHLTRYHRAQQTAVRATLIASFLLLARITVVGILNMDRPQAAAAKDIRDLLSAPSETIAQGATLANKGSYR
jgi:hypothetical protein